MYDILRLFKQIYHRYPPKFWYTILFFVLLLFFAKPLVTTVTGIIYPPETTATPRPTQDILQPGRAGEPLPVLDTYYTLLGYREYDSACVPIDRSVRREAQKTAVIEFWARQYGDEPVRISNFYLRDVSGRNYTLTPSARIGDYRGTCGEPLSEGMDRPNSEITLEKGYGSHIYLYSREIPLSAEGLEFTFQAAYSIPYPVTGTPEAGSSKIFIPLPEPGTYAEPPESLLGVPDKSRLSDDRTAVSGSIAFAVNDAYRIAGDNDRTGFYLELLCRNISGQMMDLDFNGAFKFAVVDDYGVAISAEPSLNMGYNSSFAPDEIQKYLIVWTMEQPSVRLRNFYLRIRDDKENRPDVFIRIPFKESMLTPTETPAAVPTETAPAPVSEITPTASATPAGVTPCGRALSPILQPGDTAAVTYTPPVANRFRKDPGFSGTVIGMLEPGSVFRVMDGPVCADGLYWYRVNYNGINGWTAESDDGQYWLEKR